MSGTEEEVGGEPVDEIAKIAGPVGGLWVAYNCLLYTSPSPRDS